MLSRIAMRSINRNMRSVQTMHRQMRPFGQLAKEGAIVKNTVAKEEQTLYELQEFSNGHLKAFFDQDALLYPIEQIIEKVECKDYRFFLQNKNFLKVVDTLEKFQKEVVELDSVAGREFVVFKRQLYQLYEIQNRSIDEHEAYSFEIERQNLKWLYNAKEDFGKELDRANAIEDLNQHTNLKGKIFKRKMMDPSKLYGLGYFALAGATYTHFPYVAAIFGSSLTTGGLTAACLAGMFKFNDKNTVNSIEMVKEGENAGKVQFTISTSPFASETIITKVQNVQGVFSLSLDDMGEDDLEANVINISSGQDANGRDVGERTVLLPADGWKDVNMLDWVLSIKGKAADDSTQDEFTDLMMETFDLKAESGKMGQVGLATMNAMYMRKGSAQFASQQIANDAPEVELYIQQMQKLYGKERLDKMSPAEFYNAYQQFAQGFLMQPTTL